MLFKYFEPILRDNLLNLPFLGGGWFNAPVCQYNLSIAVYRLLLWGGSLTPKHMQHHQWGGRGLWAHSESHHVFLAPWISLSLIGWLFRSMSLCIIKGQTYFFLPKIKQCSKYYNSLQERKYKGLNTPLMADTSARGLANRAAVVGCGSFFFSASTTTPFK